MSGTVLYELHMHGENIRLLAVVSALFGIPFVCFMWSLHAAETEKGAVGYNQNMPENLPGYCLTGDTEACLKSVITGDASGCG